MLRPGSGGAGAPCRKAFDAAERVIDQHGEQGDDHAPLQDERRVRGGDPGKDHLAEAFGTHGRTDRGGAQIDDEGQAYARQDHRQGQWQFHLEQALPGRHAHATCGIERGFRHAP
jgi:hypothetical protein